MIPKNKILRMIKNMGGIIPPLYTTNEMESNTSVKFYIGKDTCFNTHNYINGLLFKHIYVSDNAIGPYLHYANTHVLNIPLQNSESTNILLGYAIIDKIKSLNMAIKTDSIDSKKITYLIHKLNELTRAIEKLKISYIQNKLTMNTIGINNKNQVLLMEPKYIIFNNDMFDENMKTFNDIKHSLKHFND